MWLENYIKQIVIGLDMIEVHRETFDTRTSWAEKMKFMD